MEIVVSDFMLDGLEKGGVCEEGERKNFSFSVHVWKERENFPSFMIELRFQFIIYYQELRGGLHILYDECNQAAYLKTDI